VDQKRGYADDREAEEYDATTIRAWHGRIIPLRRQPGTIIRTL
jgi:hypothetical protein